MNYYLIFDFGGTAIKWALADETGTFMQKSSCPAHGEDFTTQLKELRAVYEEVVKTTPVAGIAISSPGFVDGENGVVGGSSSLPCIHNFPIAQAISEALGSLPVAMENDGNCAALGEYWKGAAQGAESVAGIVIGSGVGGGFVRGGKLLTSGHHAANEYGYMPIVELDGKTLGWSAWSTVNTAKRYNEQNGKNLTPLELFDNATPGSKEWEYVDKFYHYTAAGILCVSFAVDPQLIVVGGAVSARPDFMEKLNDKLAQLTQHEKELRHSGATIRTAALGNDANLLGALYNLLYLGCCKGTNTNT